MSRVGPRRLAFACGSALALVACHAPDDTNKAAPSAAPASPASATPQAQRAQGPLTHVMTFKDHLHVVELQVGDRIETPEDDSFDWTAKWKGATVFEPVAGAPAGRFVFRAAKAGGANLILDGDPKCLKLDAACADAKLEWTLFYVVH